MIDLYIDNIEILIILTIDNDVIKRKAGQRAP